MAENITTPEISSLPSLDDLKKKKKLVTPATPVQPASKFNIKPLDTNTVEITPSQVVGGDSPEVMQQVQNVEAVAPVENIISPEQPQTSSIGIPVDELKPENQTIDQPVVSESLSPTAQVNDAITQSEEDILNNQLNEPIVQNQTETIPEEPTQPSETISPTPMVNPLSNNVDEVIPTQPIEPETPTMPETIPTPETEPETGQVQQQAISSEEFKKQVVNDKEAFNTVEIDQTQPEVTQSAMTPTESSVTNTQEITQGVSEAPVTNPVEENIASVTPSQAQPIQTAPLEVASVDNITSAPMGMQSAPASPVQPTVDVDVDMEMPAMQAPAFPEAVPARPEIIKEVNNNETIKETNTEKIVENNTKEITNNLEQKVENTMMQHGQIEDADPIVPQDSAAIPATPSIVTEEKKIEKKSSFDISYIILIVALIGVVAILILFPELRNAIIDGIKGLINRL